MEDVVAFLKGGLTGALILQLARQRREEQQRPFAEAATRRIPLLVLGGGELLRPSARHRLRFGLTHGGAEFIGEDVLVLELWK
jgi:hypothetical protein